MSPHGRCTLSGSALTRLQCTLLQSIFLPERIMYRHRLVYPILHYFIKLYKVIHGNSCKLLLKFIHKLDTGKKQNDICVRKTFL